MQPHESCTVSYTHLNKLVDKIKKTNAPIVVGLDPMLSYVPEHITKKISESMTSENLITAPEGITLDEDVYKRQSAA